MRSISCAIISFVLFYIALHFKKNHWKQRGLLIILSLIMVGTAMILMIFGM